MRYHNSLLLPSLFQRLTIDTSPNMPQRDPPFRISCIPKSRSRSFLTLQQFRALHISMVSNKKKQQVKNGRSLVKQQKGIR
ncbi:hypothetical protein FJTKL_13134 [Diaporthe vaccinii]|uniref:Uncharacterized protein n=1 Tax=Diaporthe vaccinii TaxID=105482 RepID=A0ABR4EBJ6_9PEZI